MYFWIPLFFLSFTMQTLIFFKSHRSSKSDLHRALSFHLRNNLKIDCFETKLFLSPRTIRKPLWVVDWMCANWSKLLLFDPLPRAPASLSPRFLEKCIVKKLWGKTVCMAAIAILQWVILGNSNPADYAGSLLAGQTANECQRLGKGCTAGYMYE